MPTLRNLNTSCCQGCWLESVGFGALLLGYYKGEKMVFAGKVGTGFNEGILSRLGRELAQLETKTSPFAAGDAPSRGVH
jgi:bifunctional non-homologous end joining protein LigD